tara:strand:- start:2820 stop:3758 length:939 start_codon:yes stop_codon:yes gene_type:complete
VNILIIGNGVHTNKRIHPALSTIENINKITIGDRNTSKKYINEKGAEVENVEKIYKNNHIFDLVIISTPPDSHMEILEKIYNKSNKILIEKPLATNLELISNSLISDSGKTKVYESLMYFHHPIWSHVKKLIASNNITNVNCEFSVPHLNNESFRYSKKAGGGSLNDQGIYPISLASNITKDSYALENIVIEKEAGYEVDLGGTLNLLIDDKIQFNGKWGLGKDYKNYLEMKDANNNSYYIDFIFSKPDDTESKIVVKKNDIVSEIKIGIYDQFKLMYLDFLSDKFNRFDYSSYSNLLKRYKLYQEVKEQLI